MHFNDGWVPYEERGAWLLEADIGVSAHHDHLETRFAFRTRIVDYLWAGLPVVATRGDALGDWVANGGLGRAVAPGDAEAFAAACAELLADAASEYAPVRRAAEAALGPRRGAARWISAARCQAAAESAQARGGPRRDCRPVSGDRARDPPTTDPRT